MKLQRACGDVRGSAGTRYCWCSSHKDVSAASRQNVGRCAAKIQEMECRPVFELTLGFTLLDAVLGEGGGKSCQ